MAFANQHLDYVIAGTEARFLTWIVNNPRASMPTKRLTMTHKFLSRAGYIALMDNPGGFVHFALLRRGEDAILSFTAHQIAEYELSAADVARAQAVIRARRDGAA